jgi:hypothetical protein
MRKGAPDEEQVNRAGPAIGIAAHQMVVHRRQIAGAVGPAFQDDLVEILDVAGKNGVNPVGKGFSDCISVMPNNLPRRIALTLAHPECIGPPFTLLGNAMR